MKVLINDCYGGFGLSKEAEARYVKETGIQSSMYDWEIDRTDPILIAIVEEMGKDSWGLYAELKVVEIPDGIEWEISEYDGMEHIAEEHRTWG